MLPYVLGVLTYEVFDISTLLFYVAKDVKVLNNYFMQRTYFY